MKTSKEVKVAHGVESQEGSQDSLKENSPYPVQKDSGKGITKPFLLNGRGRPL